MGSQLSTQQHNHPSTPPTGAQGRPQWWYSLYCVATPKGKTEEELLLVQLQPSYHLEAARGAASRGSTDSSSSLVMELLYKAWCEPSVLHWFDASVMMERGADDPLSGGIDRITAIRPPPSREEFYRQLSTQMESGQAWVLLSLPPPEGNRFVDTMPLALSPPELDAWLSEGCPVLDSKPTATSSTLRVSAFASLRLPASGQPTPAESVEDLFASSLSSTSTTNTRLMSERASAYDRRLPSQFSFFLSKPHCQESRALLLFQALSCHYGGRSSAAAAPTVLLARSSDGSPSSQEWYNPGGPLQFSLRAGHLPVLRLLQQLCRLFLPHLRYPAQIVADGDIDVLDIKFSSVALFDLVNGLRDAAVIEPRHNPDGHPIVLLIAHQQGSRPVPPTATCFDEAIEQAKLLWAQENPVVNAVQPMESRKNRSSKRGPKKQNQGRGGGQQQQQQHRQGGEENSNDNTTAEGGSLEERAPSDSFSTTSNNTLPAPQSQSHQPGSALLSHQPPANQASQLAPFSTSSSRNPYFPRSDSGHSRSTDEDPTDIDSYHSVSSAAPSCCCRGGISTAGLQSPSLSAVDDSFEHGDQQESAAMLSPSPRRLYSLSTLTPAPAQRAAATTTATQDAAVVASLGALPTSNAHHRRGMVGVRNGATVFSWDTDTASFHRAQWPLYSPGICRVLCVEPLPQQSYGGFVVCRCTFDYAEESWPTTATAAPWSCIVAVPDRDIVMC